MPGKKSESTNTDLELIALALSGNESGYARLMSKYREPVYFMLFRMVKNKDDADDLTLEAFAKAFSNLELYSSEYAFSTWLHKIATNNCIDFLRRKKGTTLSIDNEYEFLSDQKGMKLSTTLPNPEEKMIIQQRNFFLHHHISKLKPVSRRLIELRYFKELSYEEIATELNLPLGTVKVQLFRARNALFKLMENTDAKDK
jgi:RNA polymerase sigma factor (sigma-70 family)